MMRRTSLAVLLITALSISVASLLSPATVSVSAATVTSVSKLASIHFQPDNVPTPNGFIKDTGLPFNDSRNYGWVREDSLKREIHTPIDISANVRIRNRSGINPLLDTVLLMQATESEPNATIVNAAWEYVLPNGTYSVTVSVGDAPSSNGTYVGLHTINVEDQVAVSQFKSTAAKEYEQASVQVTVTDGHLTLNAIGGTDTRINYVIIDKVIMDGQRPSITGLVTDKKQAIDAEASGVPLDATLAASVSMPTEGVGVDWDTLSGVNVYLLRSSDNYQVPANLTVSPEGDKVVLTPRTLLDPNTHYVFRITEGLKDLSGISFEPFEVAFTTGASTGTSVSLSDILSYFTSSSDNHKIAFERLPLAITKGKAYTSLAVGPDNKLYASTLSGEIIRFTINPEGTLTNPQLISTVVSVNEGPRALLGMVFDPVSTASNLVLWISHSDGLMSNAPNWSGKISQLSGPDLENYHDYVINLPRSVTDHMNNGIAINPKEPHALYLNMGAMTAMGAPDKEWGMRHETLLSSAVLRLDISKLSSLPLDVKTEEGGTYDPFTPDAPLTIYATGLRNSYDLVWHSNGNLYIPNNGSAPNGSLPPTPADLPESCKNRIDSEKNGEYTGPSIAGVEHVTKAEEDYLYRVVQGGYYGHPNPQRCEWVLNGGNPTADKDVAEWTQYPEGTLPDRNYRGFVYDFEANKSPNGVIEYQSDSFGGALKGYLIVTRYNVGHDLIMLAPHGPNGDISDVKVGVPGITHFIEPLDVIEDTSNGNLYVAELGGGKITLLRPTVNSNAINSVQPPIKLEKWQKRALLLGGSGAGVVILALGVVWFAGYWPKRGFLGRFARRRR